MPGVSMKLSFLPSHSAYATLDDSVCLRVTSSSSKSVIVVPSSTIPSRLTMPAPNSRADVNCVLPAPLWPTMATLRMLEAP